MVIAKQRISDRLRRFVKEEIQTVLRLEVLLLLHEQQSRSFTAAEIAGELGFETEHAQDQLAALEASGLVIDSSSEECEYRYHPANATLGSMVEELAAAYSTQRVPILSVILAEQPDRTRLFAEAFRIIRKE